MLSRFFARLKAAFIKPTLDADLDEELACHLEMLIEDNRRSGMSLKEARRQALIALGGVEQVREQHREARGLPLLEQLMQDLRFTWRLLKRERGFACVALLIIAVGVGLNTTVFSLVNTVILEPLPFSEAERLVLIDGGDPAQADRGLSSRAHQIDTWEGLIERNESMEAIEAYDPFSVRHTYQLSGLGEPETIQSMIVSPGLFPMLGMRPEQGRLFSEDDAIAGGESKIILTYQFWQRRFGGDPEVIGESVEVQGRSAMIVGVLPEADPFSTTFFPAVRIDIYDALVNDYRRNYGNTVLMVGRMKDNVTWLEAGADLGRCMSLIRPNAGRFFRANVERLQEKISGDLTQPLLFLWVAAGFLLAIVCFNLGGLLLARGAARQSEFALRSALGASNGRVLRQLLTETGVLVGLGSLAGVLIAAVFIDYLAGRSAIEIPLMQRLRLDGDSLVFTLAICGAAALLCGITPAWKMSFGKRDAYSAVKDAGQKSSAGRGLARSRSVLVVLEVALACGLAISAGLIAQSLQNILQVDLGFEPENLIAARVDINAWEDGQLSRIESLLDRVREIPGVEAVGLTDCIPIERDRGWGVSAMDNPNVDERREFTGAHIRIVTPGFFEAMNTRLLGGRDFTRMDSNPGSIIINQSLARQFWPGEDGLGRYVSVNGNDAVRVIGIVEDVLHSGPEVITGNEMYLPMRVVKGNSWDMMVRSSLSADVMMRDLRAVMEEFDSSLPLNKIRKMDTIVARATSSRRVLAMLISGFAVIAVGMAALGLYGVISYMVAQQTKEIGVRMAMGATVSRVRKEVVSRTLILALWGIGIGIVGAVASVRFMENLLYGVNAFAPGAYIAMTIAVLLCALAAGYFPARRATRIEPIQALRAN